ncbi:Hypothetical predicted protein [Pelobates cultripes]|uniref:Reverse transcriptase n=1 Tax=Pelobates cultripes TaxID=61616 RepID=A0AAD1WUP0_PELCU|nr:Hypothetical predicted protein [Pelobates cultripes]
MTAIKALPHAKSPGVNGFTNVYYKTFADTLAPHLLKVYHQATATGFLPLLLATIITIPKPDKKPPQWVAIEGSLLKPYALANLMWLPKNHLPPLPQPSNLVTLRFKIWDKHRSTISSQTTLSPATPIVALPYCIPTFHAKPWLDKNLTHTYHILQKGDLLDFSRLRDTHGLPQTSQFSHMQLRSFLHKPTYAVAKTDSEKGQITVWEHSAMEYLVPRH